MTQRIREHDGDVLLATTAMYAAYGDRAGFDSHLHPEVTIWETDQPAGLIGLPELDALRDRRAGSPSAAPADAAQADAAPPDAAPAERPVLRVCDAVVDRWDDRVAVARYLLRATTAEGEMAFRVTDVLEHGESGWRVVHHHAERMAPDSAPAAEASGPTARSDRQPIDTHAR